MAGLRNNSFSQEKEIEIKVSEKNTKRRIIAFILLLAFGLTMIGYGLFQMLTQDPGWRAVEPNRTSELNCSEDFVFMYNVGASGVAATQEYRDLVAKYSQATVDAYQLFTPYTEHEGLHNVYYINAHPNEEIVIPKELYDAFAMIKEYGNRAIYLAPVYEQYDDMFFVTDEMDIVNYDPYTNEDVAAYYQEIAVFASDEEDVDIQLLGENKVKLYISEEYLNYAKENYITSFIDFNWMKNAFIVDYLAETMTEHGYTMGTISSYDGFCRNLDDKEEAYSFSIFDKYGKDVCVAASMSYSGKNSIVYLRNYKLYDKDKDYYYELNNGEVRTSYLDVQDGKCKSSVNNLVSYSYKSDCAEVLLNMIPLYITKTMQEDALWMLADKDIYSVYCKENVICYNDSSVEFSEVYTDDNVSYTTFLVEE